MTEQPKKPTPMPNLIMPQDVHTAYANLVRIAHTPAELVFDYARFLPGEGGAKVVSRLIMSPLGAKLLLKALTENISKYEAVYGEIKLPQKPSLADFLFKPPEAEGDAPEDEDDNG